jgi:hypothetical protein
VKRPLCLLLVMGLALAPLRAYAGEPDITPESTSSARFDVEREGQGMIGRGELQAASDLYWQKGIQLKDPVLVVGAAEQLRELSKRDRSIPAARSGLERLLLAFDMLYFLRDSATASAWQPLDAGQITTVLDRAQRVQTELQQLIAEIEAEEAAAAVPPPVEDERKLGPGTGMIIGGTVAIVLGLGAGGMGAAGLAIGYSAQQDVEDPLVYEDEHRAAEQRGRTGNVLAGVGFALAGVGVAAGAALLVLGMKKRKAASREERAWVPAPLLLRDGAGIGIWGRF